MNKLTVAAAAMIAVFAASAPAFAVDGTVQKTHAATKADAKVKPAKRPVTKGVLDLMPTQSIVKTGKNASQGDRAAPDAPSGIAVNPWIVPSFF